MGLSKLGQVAPVTPSAYYIGFYPCAQPNGDTNVLDFSGQLNNGTLGGLTSAQAWNAVALRLSSITGGSDKAAQVSAASIARWNPVTESLFIAFQADVTAPGSTTTVLGSGSATNATGFAVRSDNAGAMSLWFYGNAGNAATGSLASAFAAGTEKLYAISWDCTTGAVNLWMATISGAAITITLQTSNIAIAQALTLTAPSAPCRIGGGTAAATVTAAFRNVHLLRRPGSFGPINLANIVNQLARSPYRAIAADDWENAA